MQVKSIIRRPVSFYSQIPNELIMDNRFNASKQTALALRLLLYTFMKPDNWQFYRENIAEELGMSLSTLDRAIRSAKELGWLSIEQEDITSKEGKVLFVRPVWNVTIPVKTEAEVDSRGFAEGDKGTLSTVDNYPLSTVDSHPLSTVDNVSKTEISKTEISKTFKKPSRGDGDSWTDEDYQKVVDTYNQYRGELPQTRIVGNKLKVLIRKALNEHGLEDMLRFMRLATTNLSTNPWWLKNRYSLTNILSANHLVNYAEKQMELEEDEAPF